MFCLYVLEDFPLGNPTFPISNGIIMFNLTYILLLITLLVCTILCSAYFNVKSWFPSNASFTTCVEDRKNRVRESIYFTLQWCEDNLWLYTL